MDPGSRVCASVGGMEYPADRLTLTVMGALGMQGPFGDRQRRASAEEIRQASRGMSSRFAKLYKE